MLYFIVVWTLLLGMYGIVGLAILNRLQVTAFVRLGDRLVIAAWLGMTVLSLSFLAITLAVPLSPLVAITVIGYFCLLALQSPVTRAELWQLLQRRSLRLGLGFLIVVVPIAALMIRPVTWLDTGLYHYAAIRWFADYGTVPGVALLSQQLGFISSWFALAAPVNPSTFQGRGSAMMNGFVLLLVVLQWLLCFRRSLMGRAHLSDWLIIVMSGLTVPAIVGTNFLSLVLVSPSPDIVVIWLTGIIAWSILVICDRSVPVNLLSQSAILGNHLLPLILAIGAVAIKLTALPLLLVSLVFALFHQGWHWRKAVITLFVTLLLLLPLLVVGIVTSGCPLYPSSLMCLDLPWSQDLQVAQDLAETTRGWSVWFGSPPAGANAILWLLWKWMTAISSSRIVVFALLLSLFVSFYIIRVAKRDRQMGLLWLLGLAIVGVTFMMLNAPLLRFGMGYIVLLPALALALLGQAHAPRLEFSLGSVHNIFSQKFKSLKVVFLAFLCVLSIITVVTLANHPVKRLILPPPFRQVKLVAKRVNNVVYWAPKRKKDVCWGASLPCSTEPHPDIWMRDPDRGIQGGFVRRKP